MLTFVSIVHVVLCVFMIFVILLQPGKDAGMGAALGGGAATSAFGGRGAVTFLGKVTAFCAMAFFVTSLGLSFVGLRQSVASGEESVTAGEAKKDDAKPADTGATPAGAMKEGNKDEAAQNTPPTPPVTGTEAVPAEKLPAEAPKNP